MSTETLHSTTAGYSSYCLRDNHKSCAEHKARCSCPCHGKNGQQPPAPTAKGPANYDSWPHPKPPLPPEDELVVKGTPPPPVADSDFPCPDCDRSFMSLHALGVHRARSHGTPGGARTKATTRPLARPKTEAPMVTPAVVHDAEPWLVVVGHIAPGGRRTIDGAFVSTRSDADQVAELLRNLGHSPHCFQVNDDD
jgi:hypothetical protein